jgi:3-oxoisoapionate decarboxylase
MKPGISSYTYTWAVGVPGHEPSEPMDAFGLLQKAADYGLSLVQIADNLPLHLLGKGGLEKLRDMAFSKGVDIEVGGRGLTRESLGSYIDIAVILNARIIRYVIDGPGYKPDIPEIISIVQEYVDRLEKNNITLAIENHDRLPSSTFLGIIRSINNPRVGICLDSVNSLGIAEGLESVVDNLASVTVNLHVKDFVIKRVSHGMGFTVVGTPAGKGMLNLPWVLSRLEPWNKCQSAILELWTPPEASVTRTIEKESLWASESIQYLKQIF